MAEKHSTPSPIIFSTRQRRWSKKTAIVIIVAVLLLAGLAFITFKKNFQTNGSNEETSQGSVSDTDISPEAVRASDEERSKELLSDAPVTNASNAQKSTYYTELLLVLHDNATIIATYETARKQDVLITPGAAATVAAAYIARNQAKDKDLAREALDVGRAYIKAQAKTAGEGGADEILKDIDTTQRELGL